MKCRIIPQTFEYLQWSGHNLEQMMEFCYGRVSEFYEGSYGFNMTIQTPHGHYRLTTGDYVLKNDEGELGMCKPELFEKIFEIIEG